MKNLSQNQGFCGETESFRPTYSIIFFKVEGGTADSLESAFTDKRLFSQSSINLVETASLVSIINTPISVYTISVNFSEKKRRPYMDFWAIYGIIQWEVKL